METLPDTLANASFNSRCSRYRKTTTTTRPTRLTMVDAIKGTSVRSSPAAVKPTPTATGALAPTTPNPVFIGHQRVPGPSGEQEPGEATGGGIERAAGRQSGTCERLLASPLSRRVPWSTLGGTFPGPPRAGTPP